MKARSAPIDWLLQTSGVAAAYFLLARMALLLPMVSTEVGQIHLFTSGC